MNHIEDDEQAALFERISWKMPTLLAFHIPNGGKRGVKEAARLKRQGVRPGIPDICMPVARGGYHGLYIELKRPIVPGKPKPLISDAQKIIMDKLAGEGYAVAVCYGADAAFDAIKKYLEQK